MSEKPNAYILIGAPGAGKSFYCGGHFEGLKIISCDEIREGIFGFKRSYEIRRQVRSFLFYEISKIADEYMDFVIDSTYYNFKIERQSLFELLYNYNIHAIYIDSTIDNCIKRNKIRPSERVVSEEIIRDFHLNIQPPSPSEGFKTIIIIS